MTLNRSPKILKFIFYVFSLGGSSSKITKNISSGEKLCSALQNMGTTFIKLGQFLATRPDIIGEEIAKKLENLQDKLQLFRTSEAKEILRREIGKKVFDSISI